jgi:2-keto-4-pentenoate hydratase
MSHESHYGFPHGKCRLRIERLAVEITEGRDGMERIKAIAEKLSEDWKVRAPYETLSGDLAPTDLAEAYAAQAAVQEKLAEQRGSMAGRKIALSSKAMQQMVGIDSPVGGAFFRYDIRFSPAEVPATEFRRLGLEYELAIELGRDVGPQQTPHTADSVRALIAGVRPAFELIEDRAADYAKLDILTLVADNAWCGGVVLGELIEAWQDLDLADLPAVLYQDGHDPEDANTGAADPLGSFAWVLNHTGGRGQTVSKGEHVITGSVLRTRFPVKGDRLRYEVSGRWGVELTVV